MQTKATPPVNHLADRETLPLIRIYFEFNQLKQLFRQGWLRCGLDPAQCESVAEHTLGVALLAMFVADTYLPDTPLDPLKVLRIALLHDFGEIHAGDITPYDGVPREDKHRRERMAIEEIFGGLPGGEQYVALWEEYEENSTPEARFVRQIDRLEMVMQATVYEHQQGADLTEFFDSASRTIAEPELRKIMDELQQLRTTASHHR